MFQLGLSPFPAQSHVAASAESSGAPGTGFKSTSASPQLWDLGQMGLSFLVCKMGGDNNTDIVRVVRMNCGLIYIKWQKETWYLVNTITVTLL